MWTYVAAFLIALSVGFGAGWKTQGWRYESARAEALTLERKQADQTRAAERRQSVDVQEAINASRSREQAARAAADGARSELDGLRRDIATGQRDMPDAASSACAQRVATLGAVFEQCATALEGMAGKADRHASDALMLRDGWVR